MNDWGRILVSTRLEKQVTPRFFQAWSMLIARGLRQGDGFYSVAGQVAHKAQNDVVRRFLQTECDTLLTLDSDADVTADFLERFRSYEPGYVYDILQAFYPRRGWPPRAIWMKRNALGDMMEHFITDPDTIADVDMVGTHACLFRREVFTKLLGDHDPATFEWFFYPRHQADSEDGAFSAEAQAAGFRLGATTAVRAGHVTEVTTSWDTYQEYLQLTGRTLLIQRYDELAHRIAEFSGETPDLVAAKAANGSQNVRSGWKSIRHETAAEERAFYGDRNNGYLYDLLSWNCQPLYERIIAPLRQISGQRVLVMGCGLGTEADVMADHNQVACYDVPGVLRDFAQRRLGERVYWLDSLQLARSDYSAAASGAKAGSGRYDLIVAIDVLEHIHPDEIGETLSAIDGLLSPGGHLYAHNNWGQQDIYPMHHDHSDYFQRWCDAMGMVQEGEFLWRKS